MNPVFLMHKLERVEGKEGQQDASSFQLNRQQRMRDDTHESHDDPNHTFKCAYKLYNSVYIIIYNTLPQLQACVYAQRNAAYSSRSFQESKGHRAGRSVAQHVCHAKAKAKAAVAAP
jgi:hypothetical protein